MKAYDRHKSIISIHIPKCAGNSFRRVLKKWFGLNYYSHYYDEKRSRMPIRYDRTIRYKLISVLPVNWPVCIHGHFNKIRDFGVQDYYPEVDQFITFLRDPFEKHLSSFFFHKKRKSLALHNGKLIKMAVDPTYDLERYLAENKRSSMLLPFPRELTMANYKEILEKYFVYVGIAEDLQNSVTKLARKLRFTPNDVPVLNVSHRYEDVPDGSREEFIHNNPLEFAVYECVLKHYKD